MTTEVCADPNVDALSGAQHYFVLGKHQCRTSSQHPLNSWTDGATMRGASAIQPIHRALRHPLSVNKYTSGGETETFSQGLSPRIVVIRAGIEHVVLLG